MEKQSNGQKRYWVTKYLFTRGIIEVVATPGTHEDGKYLHVPGFANLFCKNEWHLTRTCAVEKARKMVEARKKKLRAELDGLDAFDFTKTVKGTR